MNRHALSSLLLFVALVALTAASGAMFEPGNWYVALNKPAWTPPGWLFGPVWSVLYLAIAIAGWLEWEHSRRLSPALMLWGVQLLLNASWSWIFFGLHLPAFALLDIAVLMMAIIGFMFVARHDAARWLFLPYAAWTGFASALNLAIVQLNG